MNKKLYPLILTVLCYVLFLNNLLVAQSNSCINPSPICGSVDHYDFPLSPSNSIPPGTVITSSCIPYYAQNSVGWYYFQVDQGGDFYFLLENDNYNQDLGVTVYGPFPSVAAAGASCGTSVNPTTCDYDADGEPSFYLTGTNSGDVYVMLVTSSTHLTTDFSLSQGIGVLDPWYLGTTNCNIFGGLTVNCPPDLYVPNCNEDIPEPYSNAFYFINAGGLVTGCTNTWGVSHFDSPPNGSSCPGDAQIIHRTYLFTDQCGNIGSCSQRIEFEPSTKDPFLSCPPVIGVSCGSDIDVLSIVDNMYAEVDCDLDYTLEVVDSSFLGGWWDQDCDFADYNYLVALTDKCGRSAYCNVTFTVYGDDPVFVGDNINYDPLTNVCYIDDLYKECGDPFIDHEDVIQEWIDGVQAEGNCGQMATITTNYDPDNFVDTCGNGGIQVVTFTARDECGRESVCYGTIYSLDSKEPNIYIDPKDSTVSCDGDAQAAYDAWLADNGGAAAIDCCGMIIWSNDAPDLPSACDGTNSSVVVTFTASDECGISVSETATFTVEGNAGISLINSAMDLSITCATNADSLFQAWLADNGGATAGSCGAISWSTNPATPSLSGSCASSPVEVTFIASDACGDSISSTASFTLNDAQAPSLSFNNSLLNGLSDGATITVECDDVPSFSEDDVIASDECSDASINLTIISSTADCIIDGYLTSTNYQWTATDNCGNASSLNITVQTVDTTAPSFTSIPINTTDMATASDNCDTMVDVTFEDIVGNGPCDVIRTWTATDDCGNTVTATQNISADDSTPPTLSGVPTDVSAACDNIPANTATVTASDNLDTDVQVTFTETSQAGTCDGNCTIIRTWTATDDCGNAAVGTQTITVSDTTPPTLSDVPVDLTIFCSEDVIFPNPVAADNCSDATITFVDFYNDGADPGDDCNEGFGYDITRVWTATDACGNTFQAITEAWVVPDNYIGPTFTFIPESRMIGCGENPEFGTATCTSPCGNLLLTYEDNTDWGDCNNATSFTRTWTALDECGNTSTATQTLTIPEDNEAPVFTFVPDNKIINCGETITFGTPACTDNCNTIDHLNVSFEDITLADGCAYQRIWTVTDACGNVAQASQTIDISDNEAPIFSSIEDEKILSCGSAIIFDEPTAIDGCSAVNISVSNETMTPECAFNQIQKRTWTAVDACGNTSTISQTIRVEDNELPIFTTIPESKEITCGTTFEFDTPEVIDACSAVNLTFEDTDIYDECTAGNSFQRTWTATDECGNVATISQVFTMKADTDAPVFDITPQDKVIGCEGSMQFDSPAATDLCSGVLVDFKDEMMEEDCAFAYSMKRTWTATDGCGNATIISQTIRMEDNEAPTITTNLENKTISCGMAINFDPIEANDGCSTVEITYQDTESTDACTTIHTRTWSATDECGNVKTTQQAIRIDDTEAPLFTNTPSDVVLSCSADVPEFDIVEVNDECSNVELTFEDQTQLSNCGNAGTYQRIWSATDACGNQRSFTQTIIIEDDTEAPLFTNTPSDVVLSCSADVPEFDIVEVNDECSNVELTFEDQTQLSNCGNAGTYQRIWSATDACGNQRSFTQTIIIEDDTEAPLFTNTPSDVVLSCSADVPEFDIVEVNDDCSNVELTFEDQTQLSNCGNAGTYQRIWSATDACGNQRSFTQTITIEEDNIAPQVLFPLAEQVINCDATPEFDEPAIDENCSEVSFTFVDTEEMTSCGITYTREWTITDACGNASTATHIVRQEDTEAPTFTNAPSNMEMTYAAYQAWEIPVVQANDNCHEVTISEPTIEENGNCEDFRFSYTWEAADACGNVSFYMMNIKIVDIIPDVEIILPDEIFCETANEIEVIVTGGAPNISYEWSIQAEDSNWELMPNSNGGISLMAGEGEATIYIGVTDSDFGCHTGQEITVACSQMTNISEIETGIGFRLLPNPASTNITLDFEANSSGDAQILIYDLMGKVLVQQDITYLSGKNTQQMDISHLAAATYVVAIQTKETAYFQKLVKIN